MIFAGNFFISVQNTKEYIQTESVTKAQDTATSLGMTLKSFIQNKHDPQIETTIKAIANRGFYKEVRLEDVGYSFMVKDIIDNSKNNKLDYTWSVTEVTIDPKYGEATSSGEDDLGGDLESLDSEDSDSEYSEDTEEQSGGNSDKVYGFTPSDSFKNGDKIPVKFIATKDDETIEGTVELSINNVLVSVKRPVKFDEIPDWFIEMLDMKFPEQKSEISDGWKTAGVLYVSANPGDAYAKLYEQAKGAVVYAAIAFTVAIVLMVIFLSFILKPLKEIEKLAQNISVGKFEIIEKLPYTTEIKNVATAMNDMSKKIEGMIGKVNQNLENMTKQLSNDELTGLPKQQTFETDMKNMFIKGDRGYVYSIKLDGLGDFAKQYGNKEVDKFIKSFTNVLKDAQKRFGADVSIYRYFGSEFGMIVRNISYDSATKIALFLQNSYIHLAKVVRRESVVHIGATPFNPIGTTPGIVKSASEAFEKSLDVGPNGIYIRDDEDLAKDMQEWRDLVCGIIDEGRFNISYINKTYDKEQNLVIEEAFSEAFDNNNDQIPIGTFISIAESYDRVLTFDKGVVDKVINYIREQNISHDVAINLSLDSIAHDEFRNWLIDKLKANSDISNRLVFSVTAYGAAKDTEMFKKFVDILHTNGSKIVLKRFETKFVPLDNVKDFNLDYIRLARDYTKGIAKDASKKAFVESMSDLGDLLNIKILAEAVKDDEDFEILSGITLAGISR
jgi:EAL domain-containing protein (putative c-di-GMP-specific phosphodiesterase class I)/GGDEF domain-containing protein